MSLARHRSNIKEVFRRLFVEDLIKIKEFLIPWSFFEVLFFLGKFFYGHFSEFPDLYRIFFTF